MQAWAQDSLSGAALPWALWAIRGSAASAAGGRHMLATRFMIHAAMFPWGVGDAGRDLMLEGFPGKKCFCSSHCRSCASATNSP